MLKKILLSPALIIYSIIIFLSVIAITLNRKIYKDKETFLYNISLIYNVVYDFISEDYNKNSRILSISIWILIIISLLR